MVSTYNEVHVNIVQSQALQALVKALLNAGVVSSPDLGHDEDVLALHTGSEGLLETLANLVLIAVAIGTVDELVVVLQGKGDGVGDLTRLGLPSSETEGRHGLAIVELEGGSSHCV